VEKRRFISLLRGFAGGVQGCRFVRAIRPEQGHRSGEGDDLAMAQNAASSFATTMHIAIVTEVETCLVPQVAALANAIERHAAGGHHGCWSRPGYAYRLRQSLRRIDEAEGDIHDVFAGEAPQSVAGESPRNRLDAFAHCIAVATCRPFILAGDMSAEGCSADPVIAAMAAIRGLAVAVLGIAEDVGRAAGAAVPKGLTSSSSACLDVIAENARIIAGIGRPGSAHATPPAIVRSVLNAVTILGGVCNAMRSVFTGTPGADARVDEARRRAGRRIRPDCRPTGRLSCAAGWPAARRRLHSPAGCGNPPVARPHG
jgi:fumarate hydratase, class II